MFDSTEMLKLLIDANEFDEVSVVVEVYLEKHGLVSFLRMNGMVR